MVRRCALTTVDNPFNPFEQFTSWFLFDEEKGYHSSAYLGRIARTSDQLSDEENNQEIERAIDVVERGYDVRCFGYDPYNAKEFVERWASENGPFGIEKVIQGAKTESVPLGELKKLSEERMLLFDEELMSFCMGNCITITDTNGNRKLYKKRGDQKIDAVAAMMDAYIAYKLNRDAFE